MSAEDRILLQIAFCPITGCWLWSGSRNSHGYGELMVDGKKFTAHRHLYEKAKGPIPADLELDHLCCVRACCNPAHLEAVDHRENIIRGKTVASANASKVCCPKCGSKYSTNKNGSRKCIPCRRVGQRIRRSVEAGA